VGQDQEQKHRPVRRRAQPGQIGLDSAASVAGSSVLLLQPHPLDELRPG
jgi:hypothetical protein